MMSQPFVAREVLLHTRPAVPIEPVYSKQNRRKTNKWSGLLVKEIKVVCMRSVRLNLRINMLPDLNCFYLALITERRKQGSWREAHKQRCQHWLPQFVSSLAIPTGKCSIWCCKQIPWGLTAQGASHPCLPRPTYLPSRPPSLPTTPASKQDLWPLVILVST